MKILLTRQMPPTSLALLDQWGWQYDIVPVLQITPAAIGSPGESDLWVISSRNSLAALRNYYPEAPSDVYVVGTWLKEKLSLELPGKSITSFSSMKALTAGVSEQSFRNVIYFCADNHRAELETAMKQQGRSVNLIVTHKSEQTFPYVTDVYDAVVVFSPRSAESLLKFNTFGPRVIFVCIGMTTEWFLHENGIENTFRTTVPDSDILLREFYESQVQPDINRNI